MNYYDRLPREIANRIQRAVEDGAQLGGVQRSNMFAIPFMWNAVGRGRGSVFVGEGSFKTGCSRV